MTTQHTINVVQDTTRFRDFCSVCGRNVYPTYNGGSAFVGTFTRGNVRRDGGTYTTARHDPTGKKVIAERMSK